MRTHEHTTTFVSTIGTEIKPTKIILNEILYYEQQFGVNDILKNLKTKTKNFTRHQSKT
ncbi:hypothetical protein EELLY_v1c07690 [Entomoplasma ellychniae]|uniref:Uncharacterized protein n=1 Tax=Entomoplasma ellychniae TaxID=2114 RepID=A0A8E2QWQ4_9MOLU|nr:hypothetical protein [Entomoplasma ellychniae]PPE05081.1 hypothetical protein EELLY_v1c07690 [Entomoplasma ellychniae]